jgi:hypothetical protein
MKKKIDKNRKISPKKKKKSKKEDDFCTRLTPTLPPPENQWIAFSNELYFRTRLTPTPPPTRKPIRERHYCKKIRKKKTGKKRKIWKKWKNFEKKHDFCSRLTPTLTPTLKTMDELKVLPPVWFSKKFTGFGHFIFIEENWVISQLRSIRYFLKIFRIWSFLQAVTLTRTLILYNFRRVGLRNSLVFSDSLFGFSDSLFGFSAVCLVFQTVRLVFSKSSLGFFWSPVRYFWKVR